MQATYQMHKERQIWQKQKELNKKEAEIFTMEFITNTQASVCKSDEKTD